MAAAAPHAHSLDTRLLMLLRFRCTCLCVCWQPRALRACCMHAMLHLSPQQHVYPSSPACTAYRCAWLNHSSAPHDYMHMVEDFPRIRAWFSGHFHLSHNYADSIVATSGCAFVQTGVIGPHCNRDGERHSRLLRLSDDRCQVLSAPRMHPAQHVCPC